MGRLWVICSKCTVYGIYTFFYTYMVHSKHMHMTSSGYTFQSASQSGYCSIFFQLKILKVSKGCFKPAGIFWGSFVDTEKRKIHGRLFLSSLEISHPPMPALPVTWVYLVMAKVEEMRRCVMMCRLKRQNF